MGQVIILIALFTYGILFLMKSMTFGKPPFLLRYIEILTVAITIAFVLIIETFK